MIYNIFNKDESLEFFYGSVSKLIQSLRAAHLAEGGNPVDFPAYLKSAGVEMDGPLLVVTDEFSLIAKLKYK